MISIKDLVTADINLPYMTALLRDMKWSIMIMKNTGLDWEDLAQEYKKAKDYIYPLRRGGLKKIERKRVKAEMEHILLGKTDSKRKTPPVLRFAVVRKANMKKSFYSSTRWRRIRYQVFLRDGRVCALCRETSKNKIVFHIDHIVPLSKDWSKRLDINNLQVLCAACNIGKSNIDATDWR